jgi:uncharacterized protein YndB with AHSA1/START domain
MSEKFEITRVFEATRGRVWDAWTKPEQLARWLAPKGTASEVKHFELKPGGHLHSKLTDANGNVSWGKNVYREINPQDRLVWEQGFSNESGDIVPAPLPMPWPLLMLTTVLFEDEGSHTRLTLTWEPINPTKEELESFVRMLSSMTGGWTGTFDQLDAFLTSE